MMTSGVSTMNEVESSLLTVVLSLTGGSWARVRPGVISARIPAMLANAERLIGSYLLGYKSNCIRIGSRPKAKSANDENQDAGPGYDPG